ncbi:MAG: hypothetical protein VKK42_25925 [Lyngbya sp.]|nr:hypothetical protein [Lyngbya sp.]
MKLHQLLTELSHQGVKLWAEGDQLRLRAPKGVLTDQHRRSISALQPELLRLLKEGKLEKNSYFLPEIVFDPQKSGAVPLN